MGASGTALVGTFEWLRMIRNLDLPPAVKNTAGWLCSYADPDGTHVYPGVVKLATATGLTRDTINEVLAALRGAGLLTRTKRGGGRGVRLSDEYELTLPALSVESPAEELERLVAAEWVLARKRRREREHARYESRKTNGGIDPEGLDGETETNRGKPDTSRGITETNRGATTAPTRSTPTSLNHQSEQSDTGRSQAEVEGSPELSGQDLFADETTNEARAAGGQT